MAAAQSLDSIATPPNPIASEASTTTLTTTIDDLPLELLPLILSEVAYSSRTRCRDLRNASLISHRWRSAAQAELWSDVRLLPWHETKLLNSAALGRYSTKKVTFETAAIMVGGQREAMITEVLRNLVNLRQLNFSGQYLVSLDVLTCPSLASLESLEITHGGLLPFKATISSSSLPFQLRRLTVDLSDCNWGDPRPSPHPISILLSQSALSLRQVSLVDFGVPSLPVDLSPALPSLQYLTLINFVPYELSSFSVCGNLREVELMGTPDVLEEALLELGSSASPLKELRIMVERSTGIMFTNLVQFFTNRVFGMGAFAALKALEVTICALDDGQFDEGEAALSRMTTNRGIALIMNITDM